MNKTQKKIISDPGFYLMHYNHNHDSLGRFANGNGTGGSNKTYKSYTDDEKSLMRLGDSGIEDLERERYVAQKKNIFVRRKRLKEIDAQLAERAPKALEAGQKKVEERNQQIANEKKLEKEYQEYSSKVSKESHNNSAAKLKERDDYGVLSGNIHFGGSNDVAAFLVDESKNGIDKYNKISNDNKFENDMRKVVTDDMYRTYKDNKDGWAKDRFQPKLDIYKNTKCIQLQVNEYDPYEGDVMMLYTHQYGKNRLDYERWLVTYDSTKKKVTGCQPF